MLIQGLFPADCEGGVGAPGGLQLSVLVDDGAVLV